MLREPQHRVQGDEHRDLQEHGPAAGERVDPPLPVQLHHLLVELLLVPLVLLLELLDLGLQGLHGLHGPDLLEAQREQQQADPEGQDDDRQPVVVDDGVDRRQDRAQRVEDGLPEPESDHGVAPLGWCMTASYRLAPGRGRFRGGTGS